MKINEKFTATVEEVRGLLKVCKWKLVRVPSLDGIFVPVTNDDIERCLQTSKAGKTLEVLVEAREFKRTGDVSSIKTLHIF